MDDGELLEVLDRAAAAVRACLSDVADLRAGGDRDDQYALDIAADAVAVTVLESAGLGVMSEETGRHHPDREICVVLDPIDGSTNASRGIPWYNTSLAAVDSEGLRASMVVNQASGVTYSATRGGGAFKDGVRLAVGEPVALGDAVIAMNAHTPVDFGWGQYRAFGAAALDICLVAEGAIDAYLDCDHAAHGAWDYLGGLLVLSEAGGVMADCYGAPLVTLDHAARRTPVAASSPELLDVLVQHRKELPDGD